MPRVRLGAFTSGLLTQSAKCRLMDTAPQLTAEDLRRFRRHLIVLWAARWLTVPPEGGGEPSRESRQAEPQLSSRAGPQQLPDSKGCATASIPTERTAYPTEAKEKERERRKAKRKTASNDHVVKQ